MRSELLETTGPEGLSLRVEFLWHVDRYRHVISAALPGRERIPLLESIEGSATEDWPPSPALQSLSFQTFPDSRCVAMLLGKAGRSHWSASVEELPGTGVVVFDVACHVNDRWPYLGSRYRLLGQALTPTSGGKQKTVQVRLPQATVEITTELDQPQYYALSVSGDGELEISAAPENYKQPATVRWNYRIQIHGRDCR